MNFAEKSAIVTGAAVGIGRAVSHKLALLGANLSLIDVNEKGLAELKKELEKYSKNLKRKCGYAETADMFMWEMKLQRFAQFATTHKLTLRF